jgi:valyl-tRNA synthetase
MALSTRYNPQETEKKWYDYWIEKDYFSSTPDERESFSIVIPPPNVTGVLHMGHMLNNTIQDILIRHARLQGKNACWVPGTDHASIATEAKVVKMLREQGIKKGDLSREEFMKYAMEWKDKYGGIILKQLRSLGASCDWSRTTFTMDEDYSEAVIKVFVDLYKKGKLYRGLRMTNWDPEAQTVLSNEEVIYSEEAGHLYHIRYDIEGASDEHFVIATQRPETIMADAAVAVHPEDERYKHLIGKNAIIPLINRPIPIIADRYVDVEFGTGALKVTPAHDQNDYDIGQRHDLEVLDILTADGHLNENAQILVGQDRFEARISIKKLLKESGHLVELENYNTSIGKSERTGAVVEPRLTEQWFVKMDEFAATALNAVESSEVKFFPPHFWNMFNSWLRPENIRDWCISRQLWWGHRIPAWYYGEHVFVAETAEQALAEAREKLGRPDLTLEELRQDEDVMDTWASSWLWPIQVFKGFQDTKELEYYYPTSVLVTAWDIIFLWVARMIIAGYEYSEDLLGKDFIEQFGRQPFHDVYFTGMVRDNKRRKMSKSLGNSPDALSLIDYYGADGVRFGMMSTTSAGNDIIFDAPIDPETGTVKDESKLCEQGRNFCNKMWNALRLLRGWELSDEAPDKVSELAGEWMDHKLNEAIEKIEEHFENYRLNDALKVLYKLIWDDFCSWYLEMIKPEYGAPISKQTYEKAISIFEPMMILLHPFMPFVTEEIWHQLKEREEGDDCVISQYPKASAYDQQFIDKVDAAKDIISNTRDIRNNKGIKMKEALKLYAQDTPRAQELFSLDGLKEMIVKMANLESLEMTEDEVVNSIPFLSATEKFFLEVNQQIDTAAECERLKKELEYQEGFVKGVMKKLGNEKFVNNAPEQVVANERKKLADGESKISTLKEALRQHGCE